MLTVDLFLILCFTTPSASALGQDAATSTQSPGVAHEDNPTTADEDPEAVRLSAMADRCLDGDSEACIMLGDHHQARHADSSEPAAAE